MRPERLLLDSLCALIGFGPSTGEITTALASPDFPWPALVEVTSRFRLTPVVAWRLGQQGLVGLLPLETAAYFEAAALLARHRNRLELAQLARVAGLLNGCGIRPVLLKGAAALVAGIYPCAAGRFLSDIDLLVPQGSAPRCATALAAAGYAADPDKVADHARRPRLWHHFPRLFHVEEPAGIELHEVLAPLGREQLAGETVRNAAQPLAWRGVEMALPTLEHRITHCALHALADHRSGRPLALRQLLEFCLLLDMLQAGSPRPLDRHGVVRHGEAAREVRRFLAVAQLLLGYPAPPALHPAAADRLRVALHRVRLTHMPWLGTLTAGRHALGLWTASASAYPAQQLARLARPSSYRRLAGLLGSAAINPVRRKRARATSS